MICKVAHDLFRTTIRIVTRKKSIEKFRERIEMKGIVIVLSAAPMMSLIIIVVLIKILQQ